MTISPQLQATGDAVLNPRAPGAFVGCAPGPLARIRRIYLDTGDKAADEVRGALALADVGALEQVAHRMLASSRSVGATALADLCGRIEHAARHGDLVTTMSQAARFGTTWSNTRTALQALLATDGAAEPWVLVVDDDARHVDGLCAQLARLGVGDAGRASSGPQALTWMRGRDDRNALLLLSPTLPGLEGVELIQRLAQQRFAGALALLGTTEELAGAACLHLAQAQGLKVLGLLARPIMPRRLADLLAAWRADSASPDSHAPAAAQAPGSTSPLQAHGMAAPPPQTERRAARPADPGLVQPGSIAYP